MIAMVIMVAIVMVVGTVRDGQNWHLNLAFANIAMFLLCGLWNCYLLPVGYMVGQLTFSFNPKSQQLQTTLSDQRADIWSSALSYYDIKLNSLEYLRGHIKSRSKILSLRFIYFSVIVGRYLTWETKFSSFHVLLGFQIQIYLTYHMRIDRTIGFSLRTWPKTLR